ncbi:MAG: diguanylate cyclase [Candidatus Omnitrophica bacterium]|nr:diguanylate cyclase [Candidatus Omnitrophota bacterium]
MIKKTIIGVGIPQSISDELKLHFTPEIFEFLNFPSAQELLTNLKKPKISLIFIYNVLPDLKNCQELCIALRAEPNIETVPIIIISHGKENKEEKITMLRSGLIDSYVSSLGTTEELAAYANVFLQRSALEEELEIKNALLNNLSITDELTKLFNRRYLIQRLDEELNKEKRYNYPHTVLLRLIKKVEEYNFGFHENLLKFTISIGLLTVDNKDDTNVDSLFRALDKQLYEAKNSGRNKICGGLYKNLH